MSDRTIYVLKGDPSMAVEVHEGLKHGEARFGWSYEETADLHALRQRIIGPGWGTLSPGEQDCYQEFLLDVAVNDYVVYVNVPTWGLCTLARVTEAYFWKWTDPDFNHRLGVDPATVRTFDRNDKIVHPAVSARLKLQGRWWRLYTVAEFSELIEHLDRGHGAAQRTAADNLDFLAKGVEPMLLQITEQIQATHPNTDLEYFIADVLRAVPGVKDVRRQGGAGDRGADIVMVIEQGHPLSGVRQTVCVVQVKSFQGEHSDTQAVDDIRRAFLAYPEAEVGLIFSTASRAGPTMEAALEKLRNDTGKSINIFIGTDLALFVMRHGSHLLTRAQSESPAT